MAITKEELRKAMHDAGIVFDSAKEFIAEDAAITAPNIGVPAVLTTYVDPAIVRILTAPRNARRIFGERRKGDWTTSSAMFKAVEATGSTAPYADYSNAATSDVNVVYPERDNYVYQTTIRYEPVTIDGDYYIYTTETDPKTGKQKTVKVNQKGKEYEKNKEIGYRPASQEENIYT